MNWKCPQCGADDNEESFCRCACGYEFDDQNRSSQLAPNPTPLAIKTSLGAPGVKKQNTCPKCSSKKYTYYDAHKRGAFLLVSAIIILPLWFIFDFSGLITTLPISLIIGWKGISMFAKGISYYICQDCLFSIDENGKEL